jgi:transcriptional regulator with XRE-family HTH domain
MAKKKSPGLAEQLKEQIARSGLSLNQLGRMAGIGSDQLSRFMTGKRGLSIGSLDRIFRVLDLRLVRGSSPAPPAGRVEESE